MRMLGTKTLIWPSMALLLLVSASKARADEPTTAGEPRVLSEPGEITDIVDAFDGDDVFDLHLTIGYQYTSRHSHIRRETNMGDLTRNPGLSLGNYVVSNMNVASYEETTSRLNTRLDVGVYHDIAVFFRLPIILANNRKLDDLAGSASQQAVTLMGATGEAPLFSIPFKSPQRSGVDYLAVGADFGFMNQFRDPSKPTWLFGLEGRFSLGEPMHACTATPAIGQVDCAYPSDVNRNGRAGDVVDPTVGSLEGQFSTASRSPGVGRGTNGLEVHSYISKRVKYIEPYMGFRALFEFQQDRSDYGVSDLKGSLVNHPPFEGWAIFGLQIIPWEQREQFQRVTFDMRLGASYRTEGRDYSQLFDALGSSSSYTLRQPNFATYKASADPTNPSQADLSSQKVYFTGLTDVQQYATFQGSGSVTWQAGEYIKFQLGVAYMREQSHVVTLDQPCNPDFKNDLGAAGSCRSSGSANGGPPFAATGIPNPNYRPTIDGVGRRFKADDGSVWDAWLNGIVMF